MDFRRLKAQMDFIVEIDKLKQVLRQTFTIHEDRHENDAEHSWHLAAMAFLLDEHAEYDGLDLLKVMRMVLVHDIVEIDAGDTYCYADWDPEEKAERETRAADRIFAMLPADQAQELRSLWDEFEGHNTPESRFAVALDRLQPLLLNYYTDGKSWSIHGVTRQQVMERIAPIKDASLALWEYARSLVDDAAQRGLL
jgi:putative hydrolase of HD superfamily